LNVTPNEAGESRKVKVKVRVNPNGIFAVCSASIYNTIPALTNTTETTDEMMVDVSMKYMQILVILYIFRRKKMERIVILTRTNNNNNRRSIRMLNNNRQRVHVM
jgi:hypothetical protein